MLARNILLFTLLLDNGGKSVNPKIWNIFHDFYIPSDAFSLVRNQSAKLVLLSSNLESWNNSPYGQILHILDTETLQKVNAIWTKYANASNSKGEIHKHFREAIEKIVREHYTESDKPHHESIPSLTRSFGLLSVNSIHVSSLLMQQFWATGVTDKRDLPTDPICNPLFVFSAVAGDKFVLNWKMTPLAIFHFVHVAQQFYQSSRKVEDFATEVLNSAKKQFEEWSNAFITSTKQDCSGIILRFVVADPIALSFALQQRTSSNLPKPFINYSALWSGTELVFDAIDERQMPIKFNVIDSSTLCDHIGAINILIATIPLMQQSPASTIQMELTTRPWSEETMLLHQLLLTDPTFMCILLNIAPLPYLTGITTRGLLQDTPTLFDFSGARPANALERIIWKRPCSGDSLITEQTKLSFDPDDFVKVLMSIYTEMFVNVQQYGSPQGTTKPHHYTPAGFAALLAFLKPRIAVNWVHVMNLFIGRLGTEPPVSAKRLSADIMQQLDFFGVLTTTIFSPSRFRLEASDLSGTGVLSLPTPPETTIVVLSVPRHLVQPIYQKVQSTDMQCDFVITLYYDDGSYHIYSSPMPVFGSLQMDANGQTCHIETDMAGWNGSSDVHFCLSIKTRSLLDTLEAPGRKFLSLNLRGNAKKIFRNEYGTDLQIFKAALCDETKIRLVSYISRHHPTPVVTTLSPEHRGTSPTNGSSTDSPETITPDGRVSLSPPKLGVKNAKAILTRRVTLLTESDLQILGANATVSLTQTSPCTVTLTYGSSARLCQFPYPVNGQASTVRVARRSGWIEVSVPLTIPKKQPYGGYSNGPIPLVHTANSQLCSWNLPTINFNRLPCIDMGQNLQWIYDHLLHVISDEDEPDLDNPPLHLETKIIFSAFVGNVVGLSSPKERILGISVDGQLQVIFFIMGVYMDSASHSVVVDAYCFEVTPEHRATRSKLPQDQRLDIKDLDVHPGLLKVWKSALPAMIERCRDWQHTETCEFKTDIAGAEMRWMCSCGMGKVQPGFLAVKEWEEFASKVVRCAVSLLLPEPFIEQTRHQLLNRYEQVVKKIQQDISDNKDCSACGSKGKTKKCGKCGKVYYCGRECQRRHWKWHKSECP